MKRREFIQTAAGPAAGVLTTGCVRIHFPGRRPDPEVSDVFPGHGLLRLDRNENPFGPSDLARQALTAAIPEACRYPFSEPEALVQALAVRSDMNPASARRFRLSNRSNRLWR